MADYVIDINKATVFVINYHDLFINQIFMNIQLSQNPLMTDHRYLIC